MGMVTCPESLACRECADECHAELQLCPFMAHEPGIHTVRLDGRDGEFELMAGRSPTTGWTCVTL